MDFLSQFETVNSKLEIKDPRGRPAGLTVELRPYDSDEVRAVQRKLQAENMKLEDIERTPEKAEHDLHLTYAAAIVSWEWAKGSTLNGKPDPACNLANKLQVLGNRKVFRQIDLHLAREENFLPPLDAS